MSLACEEKDVRREERDQFHTIRACEGCGSNRAHRYCAYSFFWVRNRELDGTGTLALWLCKRCRKHLRIEGYLSPEPAIPGDEGNAILPAESS